MNELHSYLVYDASGRSVSYRARDEADAIARRTQDLADTVACRPHLARQVRRRLPVRAEHDSWCPCTRPTSATVDDLYR